MCYVEHRTSRAFLANRMSYCLGVTGPSFSIDTACSSALHCLHMASAAIRSGDCTSAIVAASNLLLNPHVMAEFRKMQVLAMDGICRPFDHKANGYVRSEAICAVYLQQATNARRIYATVVHTKTNTDGYKMEGKAGYPSREFDRIFSNILFDFFIYCAGIARPSAKMQQKLIEDFYDEINIDPSSVNYVEAHATGTIVGDPIECAAIAGAYCDQRSKPLLIGSIKANIGHGEGCAGLCSMAKAILSFECGQIPATLNFVQPKSNITSLITNQMIVCDKPTPYDDDYIGINSTGLGAANAHALFARNQKLKINNGLPDDNIPRLITWSGRTEEAIQTVLDALENQPLDAEYIGLLHSTQSDTPAEYLYRGYTVLAKNGQNNAICLNKASNCFNGQQLPIVWMFCGMGSQWIGMGKSLMIFPRFYQSIQYCHNILKSENSNINLISTITSNDSNIFDSIVNSFIGIGSIQIGLVDLLRELNMPMDFCIGHSFGELG